MRDFQNKSDSRILRNQIHEYIKQYDAVTIITKYPLIDHQLSQEHLYQNLAIQLVLRRYRNRVFEISSIMDDYLTTVYIAVDPIGHKNLDRICTKIIEQFQAEIGEITSTNLDTHLSIWCTSNDAKYVDHGLSRYPTEIRTIWLQEQRLKQYLTYDM
jgi:hypothetical protein